MEAAELSLDATMAKLERTVIKIADDRRALIDAVLEALDFAEDQEDVVDGPDGEPQANSAMVLAVTLRNVLAKVRA